MRGGWQIVTSNKFSGIIYKAVPVPEPVLKLLTGFKIAKNSKDLFGKYLAFGITFQIAFQTVLNLMVVVGLIPVTGVTLPFLSYGGSSLLITLCEIGIILNISRYEK